LINPARKPAVINSVTLRTEISNSMDNSLSLFDVRPYVEWP